MVKARLHEKGGLFQYLSRLNIGKIGFGKMEKQYRLKKNGAFQYVYRRGHSVACRDLVMLFARGWELKVGFSVSKKVGNAVVRNRIKRRLRECFRPYLGDVKPGLYVIVARTSAAKATFQSLQKDVRYLLKKQDALQGRRNAEGAAPASGAPAKRTSAEEKEGNRAR